MAGLEHKVRTCWGFNGGGLEAAKFWCSLLPDSRLDAEFDHYQAHEPMVIEFTLAGAPMMILNAGPEWKRENAASISVLTETQEETDRLWAALLEGGGEEGQCGWIKDRFGVSWQIVPRQMPGLLSHSDRDGAHRAMAAMMTMRKLDIHALQRAFTGD